MLMLLRGCVSLSGCGQHAIGRARYFDPPKSVTFQRCFGILSAQKGGHIASPVNVPRRLLMKKVNRHNSHDPSYQSKYKKDKVPPGFEFVFAKSNPTYYVIAIPVFILVAAISLGSSIYIIVKYSFYKEKREHFVWSPNYKSEDPLPLAYVGFVFMGVLAMWFMRCVRSVMMRMYYNRTSREFYSVILKYGLFNRYIQFKQTDVQILPKAAMEGNVIIFGNKMLVYEGDFTNFMHYNIFMGYSSDRPSDRQKELDRDNIQNFLKQVAAQSDQEENEEYQKKYLEKRKQIKSGSSKMDE